MPSSRTRIAIADDHPIFRLGVRTLLEDEDDFELVGEASTGEAAIAIIETLRPDILLLDLNLPGIDGIEVLRRLEAMDTKTRTVLITAVAEPAQMREAVQHGAYGVMLKHTASDLLVRCVRQVATGEYFLAPGEIGALVAAMRAPRPAVSSALTPREVEMVRGVVKGLSNKEIAAQLDVTEQTVKNHLRNVFEKLKVENRVQLATLALAQRIDENGQYG